MQRPRPRPASRRRRLLWRLLLTVLVAPVLAVVALRWLDPPGSAFILAERLAGGSPRQDFVPIERISPQLAIAVVAAEDQKFPEHAGFDLEAIAEVVDSPGAPARGASTLSQQVAKNLFLWRERSWLRKGLEAGLTVLVEAAWPKRRILEVYLNVAEFGPGVYGAEAAARAYFGKPAAALTAREAALLAAVLPNPRVLRVDRPSAYVHRRADWIQRQVRQLGGPAWLESRR
jgi:monofunctional glycosyltransferase